MMESTGQRNRVVREHKRLQEQGTACAVCLLPGEYRKIKRPFPPTASAYPMLLCSRWCPRLASARTPRAAPLARTPPGRARGAPRHWARPGRVAGDGWLGRLEGTASNAMRDSLSHYELTTVITGHLYISHVWMLISEVNA